MITRTVRATFDGSHFQISDPVDLEPNTNCILTIEVIEEESYEDPFKFLLKNAGTVIGPPDWSVEHDHYLYGTPKRGESDE
ncbi:MAG: hypothetical protein JXA44_13245 [Methanospirillaceae archaeon]|nr:hypothetical protein [Methanospirillaceae archaeon]